MQYQMARRIETWLPAVAGLTWLASAEGPVAFLLAAAPGSLLVTATVGTLLFPGDRHIPRTGAVGALLGVLLAVPVLFFAPLTALLLAALSAAGGIAAGRIAVEDLPLPGSAPAPESLSRISAEVALDEAALGILTTAIGVYNDDVQARVGEELEAQLAWLRAGGWTTAPATFHEAPPPLGPINVATERSAGLDLEVLRYDSEFAPRHGAPGRDRWLRYGANLTSETRLVRARDSRDWLLCIHGLGMGYAPADLRFLRARWLYERGLNLALPVLPLHGRRRRAFVSGTGFVTGDVANTLHALTQTIWDLRRLIGWLREQGAGRIGLYGVSLGGYVAALLASLDDDIDFAIAGVPASELGELTCYHGNQRAMALAELHGITPSRLTAALHPVGPLNFAPRVPHERRYLFGATADRFVPPRQVEALWRHWDEPAIEWYAGAHLTFWWHPEVREFVARALDGCEFGRSP